MMPVAKKYLAEFVYGATDGTITTFAIISGVIGASLPTGVILLLGFSNVCADGFSMAASTYLAKGAERDAGSKTLSPFAGAFTTFCAFVVVGTIPLLPFVGAFFIPSLTSIQFGLCIVFTIIAFLGSGAIRGVVSGKHPVRTAFETLLIGGIAASIAFGVGFSLKGIV